MILISSRLMVIVNHFARILVGKGYIFATIYSLIPLFTDSENAGLLQIV